MGSGIVELVAKNGYSVVVREINDDFLKKGLDRIQGSMRRAVEKGKLISIVDDYAPDVPVQGKPQLVGRLVVAMEKGVLQREVDRGGDANLAAGHYVYAEAFFLD